jgi:hypothetical protein
MYASHFWHKLTHESNDCLKVYVKFWTHSYVVCQYFSHGAPLTVHILFLCTDWYINANTTITVRAVPAALIVISC